MSLYSLNKGDVVICIDSNVIEGSNDIMIPLTLHKEYKIIYKTDKTYIICDDWGEAWGVTKERFISIIDFRNIIIDEILS